MGHSFGDGLIVAAIATAIVAYLYWLGESVSDIAALLEVPENTVKSYLHRARRLLHARLAERGFDAR